MIGDKAIWIANKGLRALGLKLSKARAGAYYQFAYKKPDGSFDYDRYKAVQTAGNRRKLEQVFVFEHNIDFLAAYLKTKIETFRFGLCHGTRRGLEQKWFSERLGCEVLGTEISDTASQFPSTIQWDFHEVKPEWLGAVDFIYSNSLDHSFNPEMALDRWMSCLRPGGLCIIEHTSSHGADQANELDPFGADVATMLYLMAKWGKGAWALVDVLEGPKNRRYESNYLVLRPI